MAEAEANKFAVDILINPIQWQEFVSGTSYRSKVGIKEFAQKAGIASGIVVGRLQHEKRLSFGRCNELKRHLEWPEENTLSDYQYAFSCVVLVAIFLINVR